MSLKVARHNITKHAANGAADKLTHSSGKTRQLVLIHGWGMSSIVWDDWLPLLQQHCDVLCIDLPGYGLNGSHSLLDLEALLAALAAAIDDGSILLGYSLGGMIAAQLAQRFPQKVAALITLASNQRFVANEQWQAAMPSAVFEEFFASLRKNTSSTLKKFVGLQLHCAADTKTSLQLLRSKQETLSNQVLCHSLSQLAAIDNTAVLPAIACPGLYLFAQEDALVPATAASLFQSMRMNTVVIEDAPHALFLTHPQRVWNEIYQFLTEQQTARQKKSLDKKHIARSFSRAASTYDGVAELQRTVGEQLIQRVVQQLVQQVAQQTIELPVDIVVDLGCGTGFFASHLRDAYPDCKLIGVDLAEGMVKYAAAHHAADLWLCGDAENIPLADHSVDVIFSSLAVQWCEDNPRLFAEIERVLKPGGSCFFSTLGPNTLGELRAAWKQVDSYVHVNRFAEQAVIDRAINAAGFPGFPEAQSAEYTAASQSGWWEQTIVLEYDQLGQLTRELKALGAHNVNSGRQTGMTGKQRIRQLIAAYEQYRNGADKLPASYQVWYGLLQKPQLLTSLDSQLNPSYRETG